MENSLKNGNTRPPYILLRNLYAVQELRTGHGTTNWFQIEKGVRQGCILSPCLFNLYAEYIMWNARLDEAQTGIKIAGRNINNLRYGDDTTLMVKMVWRFLKKRGIKPPYDPAIPLLGIYPEETKTEKDTCIPVFTAALFTIARTWKWPGYPSTDEWIKKLW